ncbi:methyltransferase-like protein 27 [Ruditapes philippinarum]|uniref:methyltransferase-like protein 27 n=1 Tax=Ruditapes philippinarum TaxID=129788 RepID=UPI00295B3652|nr:methyltransferase-like protein 27 [Ruditapes philippinarum]XP_060581811.1 methyltransferase-like protein 27 [Ruditapes philippinarum]
MTEEKYDANLGAHREGMTPEEVATYYSEWARNKKYDEDLNPGTYNGPTIIADEMSKVFPEKRDELKVMDIACGTGRVGIELSSYGFKNIDGLDPAEGMLEECRKKAIYTNLYQEFCAENRLPIDDSTYDCLVIAGGMGESHIPCAGVLEMIRIVKPDGLILIVMRKEYLSYVGEYVGKLEPFFEKLQQEKKIEMVERKEVASYSFNKQGILFKMRVLKS